MLPVQTVLRSRRSIPKIARRFFVFAGVLYCLTLCILTVFQRQLVFNTQHSQATTEAGRLSGLALPKGMHQLWLRTNQGDHIAVVCGHALRADGRADPDYARRATVLFFCGKGSSIAGGRHLFQSLRRLDANVLMPDYVGFGQSSGQASETNCYATAETYYHYLRAQPDVDQKRLVIAGFSLGSGVAVDLAAREMSAHQAVAGLALFAAYTILADEAHQEYPIYPTPVLRFLLRYPFASEQKMPQVHCPVFIVHSRADHLIPFWMSDHLAAASGGPVTRLNLTHADHGYYFVVDAKTLYPALSQFLETTNHNETQPPT